MAEPANYRLGMQFVPFGIGTAGFGGGLMGRMPMGSFIGGFGNYGAAEGYTVVTSSQYSSGLKSQRAGDVADLVTGSVALGRWR